MNEAWARRRIAVFRFIRITLACAVLSTASLAAAETTAPEGQVTTIVTIRTPPVITRERLDAGFKQAVPLYEKIPGLLRKYFIVNADSFGGIYLWKDRASAEAWYSDAWRAKAKPPMASNRCWSGSTRRYKSTTKRANDASADLHKARHA
jgi:hypothetical protein